MSLFIEITSITIEIVSLNIKIQTLDRFYKYNINLAMAFNNQLQFTAHNCDEKKHVSIYFQNLHQEIIVTVCLLSREVGKCEHEKWSQRNGVYDSFLARGLIEILSWEKREKREKKQRQIVKDERMQQRKKEIETEREIC